LVNFRQRRTRLNGGLRWRYSTVSPSRSTP
jgi:hypothetical protein